MASKKRRRANHREASERDAVEPTLNTLIDQAVVGDEAKKFMEGELGAKVLELSEQDIANGQLALETVNATDVRAIEILQNEIKLARRFPKYLTDLLTRGEEALRAYKQQQQED